MKNHETYSEMIDKYLNGELDNETRLRFENEIKNDPSLAEDVDLFREVEEALRDRDIILFRKELDSIHEEVITKKQPRVVHASYLYLAAAMILVLCTISTIFYFSSGHHTNDNLFSQYYKPYETISNIRSIDNSNENTIRLALEQYNNKKYEESLVNFNTILKQDKKNMSFVLYTGICYIETRQMDKAAEQFRHIIRDGNILYIEQSEWYLALCFLSMNNTEEALLWLNKIVQRDGYYKPEASKIINKIQK